MKNWFRKKIAIYTALYGDRDLIYPQPEFDNVDYYCFTNRKELDTHNFNKVFYPALSTDSIRSAKIFKIFPQLFLPNKYDFAFWIDATLQFTPKGLDLINHMIETLKSGYELYAFNNPERDCVYDEIDACIAQSKDDPKVLESVRTIYLKEEFPRHIGLISCGFLGWNLKYPSLIEFQSEWMTHINSYSRRDQISLPYILYNDKSFKVYKNQDINIWDNEYYKYIYLKSAGRK